MTINVAQKRPFASLVDEEENQSIDMTSPAQQQMTAAEMRYSSNLIKTLMKHKRAIAFLNPVDPIAFNIPDYSDIIKNPMDLGTVDAKLKSDQYPTLDVFITDIQLIFDNCYLYNNAGDPVCQDAKKLEETFKKLLKKAPSNAPSAPIKQQSTPKIILSTLKNPIPNNNITIPVQQQPQQPIIPTAVEQQRLISAQTQHPLTVSLSILSIPTPEDPVAPTPVVATPAIVAIPAVVAAPAVGAPALAPSRAVGRVELMSDDQFKRCEALVKELKKSKYHDISWPFAKPVDAAAWGATDYYDIIKQPMDMTTYERKLYEFEYTNENELAQDIRLMFKNCYTYNPPGHDVNLFGHRFEEVFEKYWEKLHQDKSSKKSSSFNGTKKRRISKDAVTAITSIPVQISQQPTFVQLQPPPSSPSPALLPSISTTTAYNNVTVSHATNGTTSTSGRSNILRLKLSVKEPTAEESIKPKLTLTPTKPKIPGLALSKEPIHHHNGPKLAIIDKPISPPPVKKLESTTNHTKLHNHDQWLALANKPSTATSNKKPPTLNHHPNHHHPNHHHPYHNHSVKKPTTAAPLASYHVPSLSKPKISPPPPHPPVQKPKPTPPPKPAFDITQLYNQITNETKKTKEEERKRQERFGREEKIRLEADRIANEEKLQRMREFNIQAKARKEREHNERLASLNENTIDISRQRMMFNEFEKNELKRDPDWLQMQQFMRDTLSYRTLPVPGFVKRAQISLPELRAKLLSKCVRLTPNDNHQHAQEGDSDMDVE